MATSLGSQILDIVTRALGKAVRQEIDKRTRPARRTSTTTRRPAQRTNRTSPKLGSDYPGDFIGKVTISYDPHPGQLPDPGEVVWTWVVFEEDHSQGKDRPVLLIGRDGDWLLGLPLTSKDHDRDAAQEAAAGRHWVEVGRGSWDSQGRISEARVDRVIRVDPRGVRREGVRLEKVVFDRVAAGVRRYH